MSKPTSRAKFTPEERAAMRERAREAQAVKTREAGEADVRAKIAEMPESDRVIAEALHDAITQAVPELVPRTWYGMPAYAHNDEVVCFFKSAAKFKSRYASFGFNDSAQIDDGSMWPTSWGLTKLTAASKQELIALVKRAVGAA
jgi:uncharacterized protein YdhG (YjbR/CyaY superfamily)